MNLGFALEYSLGHTTHAQNLKRVLAHDPEVIPAYVDLPFHDTPGAMGAAAGGAFQLVTASLASAYLGLRPHAEHLDGILYHTQVTSLLSAGLMRRVPSVVSLDATPIQYDALGEFYGHTSSASGRIEEIKKRLNQRAFGAARHLVTWSEWAKASLVADYGVDSDKVTVVPPGIDTALWESPARPARADGPVNVLFVGGDFPRKGGDTLLRAFAALPPTVNAHLHVVTKTDGVGDGMPNVTVHRGVAPNSERLRQLFAAADVFAFPTRGDCLPLAIMEALASGLPVITTTVGALPEAVTHGETGLVVPTDDAPALTEALGLLATDDALRARLGQNARRAAVARFDAATNYGRLVGVVKQAAGRAR